LEKRVGEIEHQLAHLTPRPKYILVVRMLESWLLADEEAIGKVLGRGVKVKTVANPEAIPNAKEKLDEIFQRARKTFRYTRDDLKIAEAVKDVSRMKKCKSFAKFSDAVIDP